MFTTGQTGEVPIILEYVPDDRYIKHDDKSVSILY